MPILWAGEYGRIRTGTDFYGQWAHGILCAMCCGISGAHGSHCPLCLSPYLSVLFRTHPYRHCSQYRHCTKCSASQRECALFFGESHAHGARGETLLFPPCTPFSPGCCKKTCGTQCGSLRLEALAPPPVAAGRLSARCHSAAPNSLGAVAAPLVQRFPP